MPPSGVIFYLEYSPWYVCNWLLGRRSGGRYRLPIYTVFEVQPRLFGPVITSGRTLYVADNRFVHADCEGGTRELEEELGESSLVARTAPAVVLV